MKKGECKGAEKVIRQREVSGGHGVAGVKVAMDFTGFLGGSPRLPLLPLGSTEREDIRLALERFVEGYPEFKNRLISKP